MNIDVVQLISRWLHIVAAVTAGGGALFMLLALHPATQTLPDGVRNDFRDAVRARWKKVVMAAIGILLLTGGYNFVVIVMNYQLPRPWYHMIFGIKFLLAMAIFALASLLVGRTDLAKQMRSNAGKWLTLLAGLLLTLILLSSALKLMPHDPKSAAAANGGSTTPAAAPSGTPPAGS